MRWIAIITNKPDTQVLRDMHMQAHLDYIASCPEIALVGATKPFGATEGTGAVWIIKDATYEDAIRICENDPFFVAGIRQSVDVLEYEVAPKFEDLV